MKIINIMGYNVLADDLKNINLKNKDKFIINTINPHSYIVAKRDKFFAEALKKSDLLIPDGSGIVLAAKFINDMKISKVAGADLHEFLLKRVNNTNGKVFYMGSSPTTLKKLKEKVNKNFPNIKVETFSPPFKDSFSQEENNEIINKINNFKPDVLFIGMTAPKQEKWLYNNKDKLEFKIASCIGAVFDFYAGSKKRPSQFWIKMHLEWLSRFFKEPKRLWKRNFVSSPLFILDMIKYKIKL